MSERKPARDYSCEHVKRKYNCKICNSSIVCEHGIIKYRCKICRPRLACEHNIHRSSCKICSRVACEHGIIKHNCKKCTPTILCEHNVTKYRCARCRPELICEHKICKRNCVSCTPGNACTHGRLKFSCRECKRDIAELARDNSTELTPIKAEKRPAAQTAPAKRPRALDVKIKPEPVEEWRPRASRYDYVSESSSDSDAPSSSEYLPDE